MQQAGPLVGTGSVNGPILHGARQGYSVSISSDGNTAVVGGPEDNDFPGAAWVFTRSAGVWSQQGSKLVGTPSVVGHQGFSVAISGDGNTLAMGGPGDSGNVGAIWIFTRSGGVWTQQGSKLVGTGVAGFGGAAQGYSVALSSDGNTLLAGGYSDNSGLGAAWVLTRSAGVWTQQGKLVGSGATGSANQGVSVSLSTDGNTAVVGGEKDNSGAGAAWVFTRSGGVWTQQGSKLVGTGATGIAQQGHGVGVSGDGNTLMVGGWVDNASAGAVWPYIRSGGVWTQQGAKLVGTGGSSALQGTSVSLSSDGNTAFEGGQDGTGSWVFTRSGGLWSQLGSMLVGSGGSNSGQGTSVAISADATTAIVGSPDDSSETGASWIFATGAAGPTHLGFVQQPSSAGAGQAIAPAVTVQLLDAGNSPVAQAGTPVLLALGSGTGALAGTTTQSTNVSGLATFAGLSVNLAGSKTLSATSAGLTGATSSLFVVSAAAPAALAVSGGSGQHAAVGTAFASPLQATVTDAFGNPVPGVSVTFTPPASGASAVMTGSPATTDASGVASAAATANGTAGTYAVTAAAATLAPASFALTNDPLGTVPAAVPALGTAGLALLGLGLAVTAFRMLPR